MYRKKVKYSTVNEVLNSDIASVMIKLQKPKCILDIEFKAKKVGVMPPSTLSYLASSSLFPLNSPLDYP